MHRKYRHGILHRINSRVTLTDQGDKWYSGAISWGGLFLIFVSILFFFLLLSVSCDKVFGYISTVSFFILGS